MSVILQFSIFPTDKGESVSKYVSKVIKMIDNLNLNYQLTPMATIIETDKLNEALNIINESYKVLEKEGAKRVYISSTIDIRDGKNRLKQKIESIKNRVEIDQ